MSTLSKYYERYYIGKGIEGADEFGQKHSWDSTHPDLEPTSIFVANKYGTARFCSYCCKQAKPIQAKLRLERIGSRPSSDYDVTGYTCDCEGAESEKEYRKEQEFLKRKHQEELMKLRKSFQSLLKQDTKKMIEITLKYKKKEMEDDIKWNNYPNFSEIENRK